MRVALGHDRVEGLGGVGPDAAGAVLALVRALGARGCRNLLLRSHAELDLTDAAATDAVFASARPEAVVHLAAQVGQTVQRQVDRSQGDVHPLGNPHYWLDPANGHRIVEIAGIDAVIAMEARGFVFGAPVALALGAGIRTAGGMHHRLADPYPSIDAGPGELQIECTRHGRFRPAGVRRAGGRTPGPPAPPGPCPASSSARTSGC